VRFSGTVTIERPDHDLNTQHALATHHNLKGETIEFLLPLKLTIHCQQGIDRAPGRRIVRRS